MDPLTHALASYTLKRAAFPRIPRTATLAMLIAGTVADLDLLSSYFGPSAHLTFCRTYLHSLPAAIVFALVVTLPFLRRKTPAVNNPTSSISPATLFTAAFAAALLHLLMDLCQSAGVELFWPFSSRRFALDWTAHLDLWILGILLAGILLPLISGLVTEEIGAKSKGPRGRIGASLALAAVIIYLLLRATLHSSALATLESRSYRGESPRRVAAFAEPGSPFRWHGVLETERAIHDVEVEVGPAANFDPESAITSYKPDPSPALDAARYSSVARRFLRAARFPKATVEKTPEGYHVILRDLPAIPGASSVSRIQALIDTDPSGKVLSEELSWSPAFRSFWWK
jgi:membrane-bound metal-dependent hydrolase YbcI (DUF457 family)